MARFPEPPPVDELRRLGPQLKELGPEVELWRIYFRGGKHPVDWRTFRAYGPVDARFDHHLPPLRVQERRILYAAEHGPTCVAEVFQATRVIDRALSSPWLVAFRPVRTLRLLDLTGRWPTRAGASMAINSGRRERARRWSVAIHEAFAEVDGLYYCSSMNCNRPAVALYERACDAMPDAPTFHMALEDPRLQAALSRAARELNYGLL